MAIINPGAKVLVSGANGYVAFWLIQHLLEKGYSVRGTVRSIQKGGDYIEDYFKSYSDRFELVEVADITKEGAFDEAVKGVDAIEHVASPFHFDSEDPQDYIVPAVKGTVGILASALEYGSQVKRIVITSSTVAVKFTIPPTPCKTYSEKDFNDEAINDVETLGKNATPMSKYSASKTLAEKAAWDFYEKNKDKATWDLTVINPPYIFGPPIHQVNSVAALNTSVKVWWDYVVEPGLQSKEEASISNEWVDVRDLAAALTLSLEKKETGGERIIFSAGAFIWQDWVNAARSLNPSLLPSHTLPVGFPDTIPDYYFQYDASKATRILGIKYRTIEETTKDTLAYFAKRGW